MPTERKLLRNAVTSDVKEKVTNPENKSITLKSLVHRYIRAHQMVGSSPHTVAYYKGILSRFLWYAEQVGWSDNSRFLTEWQIREFLGYVGREVNRWAVRGNGAESSCHRASPRTVHHYYRALTAFFNWVMREGFLTKSPMSKVKVAKPKSKVIRPYTQEQIERMLAVCDWDCKHNRKFIGSRNRAIILLLLDTGLRLSELTNIRLQDINKDNGWIRVTGKGAAERVVRIGQVAQMALLQYLMHRSENGSHELWLTKEGCPLKVRGLQTAFQRVKDRAGTAENGGCHRMRHTFALSFLRADGNPFNLQYILVHNSLEMVRHYTATLGMEDALQAHIKASPADLLCFNKCESTCRRPGQCSKELTFTQF